MATTEQEAVQTANRSESSGANGEGRRRGLIPVAIVGILIVAGALGFWLYSRRYESTDDAQVAGHLNGITARIDGTIKAVYVEENQTVHTDQIVGEMDPRALMAFGFLAISSALYYMSTHISLGMDFGTAAMLRTYQTLGLAFIFIPQKTLAYIGVPREKNNQISSMNSFVRNVGGSIGIALLSTLITRAGLAHRNYLVAHTTPGAPAYEAMREGLTQTLKTQGMSSVEAARQAYGLMSGMIQSQATTRAYVDVISVLALIVLCLTPFVLIMKTSRPGKSEQPALH